MRNSFLEKAAELNDGNKAYATAFIIRRTIPSSGKPGDKAIITEDGKIFGWIGGGCTRGIVLKESIAAIKDGKPRVVTISPDLNKITHAETKTYTMTCQSGGEVDLYIEPVIPKPHLFVFGTSHIAMAISKLSAAMDYPTTMVMNIPDQNVFPEAREIIDHEAFEKMEIPTSSYFIVCTQGEGDTESLHKAIQKNGPYLSFVSSRKKANAIFNDLRDLGVGFDQLKNIKTPAGLDLGAKLPEEVAVSILAQVIQEFRTSLKEEKKDEGDSKFPNDEFYVNPVCNIPIQKSTAKHILEYKDEKVYFCCDGCKVSFEKAPEKYMAS